MSEQPPAPQSNLESNENERVTKEQVLNAYAKVIDGKEESPAQQLLIKWIDQNYAEIRAITDPQEQNRANITFDIEKAELYFETGFGDVALEELEGENGQNGIIDMARLSNEDELLNRAYDLIDKIYDKMDADKELLTSNNIMPSDVNMAPEKPSPEQQAETDAQLARNLSAEILAMLKNKS